MESLLVWWNLTWSTPHHEPVYSLRMDSELRCHHLIVEIRDTVFPDRALLGTYDRLTHICVLTVFSHP